MNWIPGPEGHVYKPDVWWVSDEHRPPHKGAEVRWVPELVIEIRSPSTWHLDTGIKREVYERAGVSELWLVDTESNALLVYRRRSLDSRAFDSTIKVGMEKVLTSPLLPGFSLSELFDR